MVVPVSEAAHLEALAGKGSALHVAHGVYLQHVSIVTVPENFEHRVRPIFAFSYRMLRLFGLDPYDLALSKLERSSARDREDVNSWLAPYPLTLPSWKPATAPNYARTWRPRSGTT